MRLIEQRSGGYDQAEYTKIALCRAMAERRVVHATYEENRLVLEPYALLSSPAGGAVLLAVVLCWGDERLSAWTPQNFEVKGLGHVTLAAATFIPNRAFDPAGYGAELIFAVQPINGYQGLPGR
jgi:hypothetical protein